MASIIVITDTSKLSPVAQIGIKEIEVRSFKAILKRRELIIEKRNKESAELSQATQKLIESTNQIRRELMVAEAELRQLKNGITKN